MTIVRRSGAVPGTDPAADFWGWWTAEGGATCAAAIERGDPGAVLALLGGRIAAVAGGLAWELGPGTRSQHQLVVTAAGDPELRAVARRWLRAAPPPDGVWEYADARGPVEDLAEVVVDLAGGASLRVADIIVAAERSGTALDVVVHHPAFARLAEDDRMQITVVALDAALGEADVETWLGSVTAAEDGPAGAAPLRELPGAVAALRAACTGPDGGPTWELLQGEGPSGPVLATVQVPLVAATAPHLDQHVAVDVAFADRTDAGLPGPGSLQALRDLEEHLAASLGDSGRLVAHQTCAGTRTLHVYVDSTGPGTAVVRAAVTGWDQGRVEVTAHPDPR